METPRLRPHIELPIRGLVDGRVVRGQFGARGGRQWPALRYPIPTTVCCGIGVAAECRGGQARCPTLLGRAYSIRVMEQLGCSCAGAPV